MAVWLVILFLECPFIELLEAECAGKMFRVEFLRHGSDAATGYGLLTAST